MIRNFASEIASKSASDAWVTRFLSRNYKHLTSKHNLSIDATRYRADSKEKYEAYFKLLHSKLTQYNLEPRHIYNMDEKGFMIGVLSRSKRVFSRQMWERREVTAAL